MQRQVKLYRNENKEKAAEPQRPMGNNEYMHKGPPEGDKEKVKNKIFF